MNRPKSFSRGAGFTMIELLVVLLVGLILILLSAPELMKYYVRSQIEGVTREVSFVLQRARFRAIKNSQDVQICGNPAGRVVTGLGQTIELPKSVELYGITVRGNCFTFLADGSVQELGEFRFSDVRGNFLKIQVQPKATARVQVLKWDETDNKWHTRDEGGKAWEWKTGTLL